MRWVPCSSRSWPCGVRDHRTRRPCRVDSRSPSAAVLVRAWRADFSSMPMAPRASISVAVQTGSPRGWTNSPRIVRRVDLALAEPIWRRRVADRLVGAALLETRTPEGSGSTAEPTNEPRADGSTLLFPFDVPQVGDGSLPIYTPDDSSRLTGPRHSGKYTTTS